jgi:hypothetical protein
MSPEQLLAAPISKRQPERTSDSILADIYWHHWASATDPAVKQWWLDKLNVLRKGAKK